MASLQLVGSSTSEARRKWSRSWAAAVLTSRRRRGPLSLASQELRGHRRQVHPRHSKRTAGQLGVEEVAQLNPSSRKGEVRSAACSTHSGPFSAAMTLRQPVGVSDRIDEESARQPARSGSDRRVASTGTDARSVSGAMGA